MRNVRSVAGIFFGLATADVRSFGGSVGDVMLELLDGGSQAAVIPEVEEEVEVL